MKKWMNQAAAPGYNGRQLFQKLDDKIKECLKHGYSGFDRFLSTCMSNEMNE